MQTLKKPLIVVIAETNSVVSPSSIVVNGKTTSWLTLSSEQQQAQRFNVFALDEDGDISAYTTLDQDVQSYIDFYNVESPWQTGNSYRPTIKATTENVYFNHVSQVCSYYNPTPKRLQSWAKHSRIKTLADLLAYSEELKPKYDKVQWNKFAKLHLDAECTIVRTNDGFAVMQNNNVLIEENQCNLPLATVSTLLNQAEFLSLEQYEDTANGYAEIGITPAERDLQSFGVELGVTDMLSLLSLDENHIRLPENVPFTKQSYTDLKKVIRNSGGKYVKNAFVFEGMSNSEVSDIYTRLLGGEEINLKKSLQFFPTPNDAAKKLISMLNIEGKVFYEPNGGTGQLVKAAFDAGAKKVITCELYQPFHKELTETGAELLSSTDALTVTAEDLNDIEVCGMNPPFSNQQDIKHVMHVCMTAPKGTEVAAIMSGNALKSETKLGKAFAQYFDEFGKEVKTLDAGTFKESGTNISTLLVKLIAKGPTTTKSESVTVAKTTEIESPKTIDEPISENGQIEQGSFFFEDVA